MFPVVDMITILCPANPSWESGSAWSKVEIGMSTPATPNSDWLSCKILLLYVKEFFGEKVWNYFSFFLTLPPRWKTGFETVITVPEPFICEITSYMSYGVTYKL